jgi:hypothetical protein
MREEHMSGIDILKVWQVFTVTGYAAHSRLSPLQFTMLAQQNYIARVTSVTTQTKHTMSCMFEKILRKHSSQAYFRTQATSPT